MAVIDVPRTPKRAFDKNRPPSALLRAQIEHLEAAAGIHPGSKRKRPRHRTEGQAAAYIGALTRQIHEQAAQPNVMADAAPSPVTKPRGAPRSARKSKRSRRQKGGRPKAR